MTGGNGCEGTGKNDRRRAGTNAQALIWALMLSVELNRVYLIFLKNIINPYFICFFLRYYISNEYKGMPGGRNLYK